MENTRNITIDLNTEMFGAADVGENIGVLMCAERCGGSLGVRDYARYGSDRSFEQIAIDLQVAEKAGLVEFRCGYEIMLLTEAGKAAVNAFKASFIAAVKKANLGR